MKVLFAVDGSDGSFAGVSQVGRLLKPGQDEVALYCSPAQVDDAKKVGQENIVERARQGIAEAVFAEALKRLPEAWQAAGAVKTIAGQQDARRGVIMAAEKFAAELIVLGARGLSALERMLLGSVTRAVVHSAKVPVWVARESKVAPHAGLRVLVSCATPEQGQRLVQALRTLHWPADTACGALTVVPSLLAGKIPPWLQQRTRSAEIEAMVQGWAHEHQEELRQVRTQMEAFGQHLPVGCTTMSPIVAEGEPASVILSTLAREQIDLVTIGAYHKNWLAETLLGSTTEAVIHHAPCSVLVVPEQPAQ